MPRRAFPRSATRLAACSGVAVAATLTLGACNTTYTVDLTNRMSVPITAWLSQDRLVDEPVRLASTRLAPGESAALGPVEAVWTDPMRLYVVQADEAGLPPSKFYVRRGYQRIEVVSDGDATYGSPRFTVIPD